MNEFGIIIGIFVIVAVVAADIIFRVVNAPHRRDRFLEDLMDSLIEAKAESQPEAAAPAAIGPDETLGEHLLRHFEQSATSRHVLSALSVRPGGLSEGEVVATVNYQLSRRRKSELPAAVVRKVVMILMGAGFARLAHGRLELTHAGKRLDALLQTRASAAPVAA